MKCIKLIKKNLALLI